MGYKATLRAMEAAERRELREAQRRQKELVRRENELAKLSEAERARLEVETFVNQSEELLSVHKEAASPWDWHAIAWALPPHPPLRRSLHEFRNSFRCVYEKLTASNGESESELIEAHALDDRDLQTAQEFHIKETEEMERMRSIARAILAGDHKAYVQALTEFSALSELSHLGSSIQFVIHSSKLVESVVKVAGKQAIPSEQKSLTSTGKLSVKVMPKMRFHEVYQDYVCSCVLRVGREVLALLPVDMVLVTAVVEAADPSSGHVEERPVLSVALSRESAGTLNFESIDPSDAIEKLPHRGDAKASRKSGDFVTILPLTPDDLENGAGQIDEWSRVLNDTRHSLEAIVGTRESLSRTPHRSQPDD